ncbi:MAG: hypothetical protein IKW33_04340 [Clostridia bacterium]|nr:hypothetical protein [Clostridia bacterium]
MQEYYKILGITEDASNEELDLAYNTLKAKYNEERFLEGEKGNQAAKNLTKLETAYAEIVANRRRVDPNGDYKNNYETVEKLIKENKIATAQIELDNFENRDAEWHYLQSVIFYKKNWINECKKQLEIAMSKDRSNKKYAEAYDKLMQKTKEAQQAFYSGNAGNARQNPNERQMGGTDCGSFVDCCATWCCINLLCNGCR